MDSLARIRELERERLLPEHGDPVTKNLPSLLDDLMKGRVPKELLGRADP